MLVCSVYLSLGVLLNVGDFYVLRDWVNPSKVLNVFFDLITSVVFAAGVLTAVFHFFGSEIAQQKWLWQFRVQNLPDAGSQAAYIHGDETIGSLLGNLVDRHTIKTGYNRFNFTAASADRNCQSIRTARTRRSATHRSATAVNAKTSPTRSRNA